MTNYEWLCANEKEFVMDCISEQRNCETCSEEAECWTECLDHMKTDNLCRRGVWEWLNKPYESASYVAQEAVCDSSESVAAKDDSEAESEPDSRERLEADVLNATRRTGTANQEDVWRWLDRQKAITEREFIHSHPICGGSDTCHATNLLNSESVERETPQTAENATSKDEIRDFDVWSVAYEIYCAGGWVENGNEPNPPTDGIWKLLDRQAAITRAEVIEAKEKVYCDCDCCKWQEERERLKAENERMRMWFLPKKVLGKDRKPIKKGQTVYGEDNKRWTVFGICDDENYPVIGYSGRTAQSEMKPLKPEWLDHEKDARSGITRRQAVKDALRLACEHVADCLGTCPYDQHNDECADWARRCMFECSADIDMAECWRRYFEEKVER